MQIPGHRVRTISIGIKRINKKNYVGLFVSRDYNLKKFKSPKERKIFFKLVNIVQHFIEQTSFILK